MVSSIPFIWIPIMAVFCYGVLMISLLSVKRNSLINSFIALLICFICWTGGSMLMRLQIWPNYRYWYELSIQSLFIAPYFVYSFLYHFVGSKAKLTRFLWFVGTLVMMILTHFQVFLDLPVKELLSNGQTIFVYNVDWKIFIPTGFFILLLGSAVFMVLKSLKKMDVSSKDLMPIFMGFPVLVVGNLLSIIPGNIIPWDTIAGIINAFFMFYALCQKRLFKITLLVSNGTVMAISMGFGVLLAINVIPYFERLLLTFFPDFASKMTLVIAVVFSIFIFSIYGFLRLILGNIFLRDENIQTEKLKSFSVAVSKSLNLQEILVTMIDVITSTLNVKRVYVCLFDKEKNAFISTKSSTSLEYGNISISRDNPCIDWFKSHNECMVVKEFRRHSIFKSMWQTEKRLILDLGISCILPLKRDGELIGIVLLASKERAADFKVQEISFLDSVQSIASVAVKNAFLYENAKKEAQTDHLTGLLNRRAFLEVLNSNFDNRKGESLALLLLNLDDFKLFNQFYGNIEGDKLLQEAALIIQCSIDQRATAGRYGGKEFGICLPGYNLMQALALGNNIRQQVANRATDLDGNCLKPVTMSGGVCVIPYGASSVKELLENTDMAVYNAKHSGKNKMFAYSVGEVGGQVVGGNNYQNMNTSTYNDYVSTIYALTAAIDAKDHYTFKHSQNVALYATSLARAAGLNEEHVRVVNEAALLHDIGKIAIPEHILSKPGKLDDQEYEMMKTHVQHSISIVRHLPSLDYVIPAVIAHHERWDGRGYPRGIEGENIPIAGRCLAIADSFEAMTSARSYKAAYIVDFALDELLAQAGRQFDPNLVPIFVRLVREKKIAVDPQLEMPN